MNNSTKPLSFRDVEIGALLKTRTSNVVGLVTVPGTSTVYQSIQEMTEKKVGAGIHFCFGFNFELTFDCLHLIS